ncbi:hypothetical protein F7R25_04055 [Burkholderia stagnalis]|uniref:Uncharacterized protein n=1 Tax=Burkholderia stagnalis TaxID=1503054 RepID=A0A6L3N3T4_9BURK|nr:hypothetical protein [Burkholderia stagnalis]KAB0640678.1 hypothetical protein F7R25_04055 [Burkholderia stagnalis]VWB06445.1 hypothetical protein BST28156_00121 [Burkholderia stagnalis]
MTKEEKKSLLEKILSLNTSDMTAKEIKEAVGYQAAHNALMILLNKEGVPFKRASSSHKIAASTINKIHQAIAELKALGTKTNTANVGKHLGISRQRVDQVLKAHGNFSILDSYQQREQRPLIAEALKSFDTANLTLDEVYNLPIAELKKLNRTGFGQFLIDNKIPHSSTIEERLSRIDTSKYTAQELCKMIDRDFRATRDILYRNKIPFKSGVRNREKMAALLERLREIDSTQYTSRELYEIFGGKETLTNFRRILSDHKVPYKKIQGKYDGKRTRQILLQKLSELETQNYSISQLATMIGTTRQTLAPLVAEHNIPTYKDRRSKDEMAPIWEKLRSVDTSQYTAEELLALLDNNVRLSVMLKHLAKNGMKYKKKQRISKFDKLLKVDTSQYTVQELQSMAGEDSNQLRKYLAKHKLSYKKVKTGSGSKPKN